MAMSLRFLTLLVFCALFSCSTDALRDKNFDEQLKGQWILNDVSCFCYFSDYDFTKNQLWFFPDQGSILSRSSAEFALGISKINSLAGVQFQDGIIREIASNRDYIYNVDGDVLTLTYVDNEQIADDEISYYFIKGPAPETCVNPDAINTQVACTYVFAPVCGCDGITYANACVAQNSGITSFSEGSCD